VTSSRVIQSLKTHRHSLLPISGVRTFSYGTGPDSLHFGSQSAFLYIFISGHVTNLNTLVFLPRVKLSYPIASYKNSRRVETTGIEWQKYPSLSLDEQRNLTHRTQPIIANKQQQTKVGNRTLSYQVSTC